ncbi:MAG: hypothetical protein MUO26_12595 [Methanotrichaceae archaeon]|nr:hypothetical protein [Methanotrichaceae archaeon]
MQQAYSIDAPALSNAWIWISKGVALRIEAENLPALLYAWQSWGPEVESKAWVREIISDNKGLAVLLEKFFETHYTNIGIRYELHPKHITPFLEDSPKIIERCRQLKQELPDSKWKVIDQFIIEYENSQKMDRSNIENQ